MSKKIITLSLGGSLIISDRINISYLKKLESILKKQSKNYKFIVVCGGGSLARKYIKALKNHNKKLQSLAGIAATRTNARFMSYFFGQDSPKGIPHSIKEANNYLKKQDIVFCGALEYKTNQTSDSTSARISKALKTKFINLTNVPGLCNKDPKKHKDAKLIPNISWSKFHKIATKIEFKPGQHFVLDQKASKIIKENKIKTYILQNPKELDKLLNKKPFKGTTIGD